MRIPTAWVHGAPCGMLVLVAGTGLGCAWVDSILWRPPPDPVPVSGRPPIVGGRPRIAAGNAVSGRAVHVVRFGDTLWDIARSNGVAVDELAQANGISDADHLQVGQRLVMPASSSPPLSSFSSESAKAAAVPIPHAATHAPASTLPSVEARAEVAPAVTASAARHEASLKRA